MHDHQLLCSKLTVKGKVFKNRMMFPPLTTGYENKDGSISEQSLNFYKRLAYAETAYIVLGDVTPIMTFSPTPKLYCDEQIPSFKALADAIHDNGGLVGLQVFYPEYDAIGLTQLFKEGKMNEARAKLHHDMTHFVNEVSKEDLEKIVVKYQECVVRMRKAEIDVVQIHGDRLCGSLCSPILNKRTDEFGGSFENRIKFALMVVKGIKEVCGDMLIEYKLPIITETKDGKLLGKGGLPLDEAIEFAKILEENGVDLLHVGQANHTGNMNDTIPAMGTRPYAFMTKECKAIKEAVSIPVTLVGRVTTPEVAEALIQEGVCDMVGLGRSLLADPDFVIKTFTGNSKNIRKCIMCNKGCTDAISSRRFVSCILNPESGYEYRKEIRRAKNKYKIAIVGGGVAGLEAARVLTLKGHDVELFEETFKLGGQLNIASVPPRKRELLRIVDYYEEQLKMLNIKVHLNRTFKDEDFDNGWDKIVVATGSWNFKLQIDGKLNRNVFSSWDVLAGKVVPFGKVLICGGGLVGVETAEYLAELGYDVEIIEMTDKIAREESATILPEVMKCFEKHNVKIHTRKRIKEYTYEGVKVDLLDKEGNVIGEELIKGNCIVEAVSSRKYHRTFFGKDESKVVYVGDAILNEPNTIEHAIKSAYDVCNKIGNEDTVEE